MKELSPGEQKLLEYLGPPYTVKTIDYEECVYLDMGEYDIEISQGKAVNSDFNIYIWRKNHRLQIVERYLDIKNDLPIIKELLDDIRSRYTEKII